ncbi:hypothetical protein VNO77_19865 [Canavalia gladiata]|uniref:Uncharacterized protein n=1 Tax=Canavalia gladiata TaxID=3824 RepID=A0AAN9LNK9_CANGL
MSRLIRWHGSFLSSTYPLDGKAILASSNRVIYVRCLLSLRSDLQEWPSWVRSNGIYPVIKTDLVSRLFSFTNRALTDLLPEGYISDEENMALLSTFLIVIRGHTLTASLELLHGSPYVNWILLLTSKSLSCIS